MIPSAPCNKGNSENTDDFRRLNIKRVHQLIHWGYIRMSAASYQKAEETDITGDLVNAIEKVFDDDNSEEWVKYYSVHDDPPVCNEKRKGKRRKRLDIRMDSSEQRPRTRFCFEAKRLMDGSSTKKYLGRDGLGCFLHGDYANDDEEAGMLGYIQTGNPNGWANNMESCFQKSPKDYGVLKHSPWRQSSVIEELTDTYRSGHERKTSKKPIEIYHTLLSFC
jgi:hypothetical protein